MATIDIKLKSYDELLLEITTLNTNKYLLEQKLNKQRKIIDKVHEEIILRKNEISGLLFKELLKILEEIEWK